MDNDGTYYHIDGSAAGTYMTEGRAEQMAGRATGLAPEHPPSRSPI